MCCNGVAAASGAAFVLHASAVTPLARVPLPAPGVAEAPRVVLVVGPDGGIAEEEHGALAQAGATAVRLGPHVMSTSTAGPVAVALLAERLGRRA